MSAILACQTIATLQVKQSRQGDDSGRSATGRKPGEAALPSKCLYRQLPIRVVRRECDRKDQLLSQAVEGEIHAYILIQTEVGKSASVAAAIAEIDGIGAAEEVTGPYDVIVRAVASNVDQLGRQVVAKVQSISGITRTLTCPVVHL